MWADWRTAAGAIAICVTGEARYAVVRPTLIKKFEIIIKEAGIDVQRELDIVVRKDLSAIVAIDPVRRTMDLDQARDRAARSWHPVPREFISLIVKRPSHPLQVPFKNDVPIQHDEGRVKVTRENPLKQYLDFRRVMKTAVKYREHTMDQHPTESAQAPGRVKCPKCMPRPSG